MKFLVILGSLAASFSAYARTPDQCSKLLDTKPKNVLLEQDAHYRIWNRKSNLLFEGFVEEITENEGQVLYKLYGDAGRLMISDADVTEAAKLQPPSQVKEFFAPIFKTVSHGSIAHRFASAMFKPYKKLAEVDPAVQVVGTLRTPKEVGEKIADNLKFFDSFMVNLGFEKPAMTRILVTDNPILPNLAGPFFMSLPLENFWLGFQKAPSIEMNPILYNTRPVTSPSALFHERTHSLTHATYSENAFVIHNKMIQEALADFFAAHFESNPQIGKGIGFNRNEPIRDLETRTENGVLPTSAQKIYDSPIHLTSGDNHGNSLMVSSLLWSLRSYLHEAEQKKYWKNLLDDFNAYYNSYGSYLGMRNTSLQQGSSTGAAQTTEYVMAVILKNSQSLNRDTAKKIHGLVLTHAVSLQYSFARIQEISTSLISDEIDYGFRPEKKEIWQEIIVKGYGIGALVVEGSAAYYLTNTFYNIFQPLLSSLLF